MSSENSDGYIVIKSMEDLKKISASYHLQPIKSHGYRRSTVEQRMPPLVKAESAGAIFLKDLIFFYS